MLPEIEIFTSAVRVARDVRNADFDKAHAAYTGRNYSEFKEFDAESRRSRSAYECAFTAAWNALVASDDPIVRFIASECRDYTDEAITVLEALPATLEQLNALAREHDWCDRWDHFLDRARETGVFGEEHKLSEARQVLMTWLRDDYGFSRGYMIKIMDMIDAVVVEAVEKDRSER